LATREPFTVAVVGGSLEGWSRGDGVPVLLLHGGPGLNYDYLDGLLEEIGEGFRIAAYQQRGVAPSTLEGPFTIAQAIDDAVAVLDALGWQRALIAGHSWGGQLALRLAAAIPARLDGMLAIDPIGVVGDGGMAAFDAEMIARTPKQARDHARALDERAMAGDGTSEDAVESLRLYWPAYFADPENVPEMPPWRISVEAYSGLIREMSTGTEAVAAELASGQVPYVVLAGGASPIPWGQASRASAELSPRARLVVVPAGGHFPWYEAPGCVRATLRSLCPA
jgi:pimeloyl-ACP methyl ester carboxylesterase